MGATCVTTEVTGHDEYIEHGRNALLVDWDDRTGTTRQLELLAKDRRLLHELRCNALATARGWPDWEPGDAVHGARAAARSPASTEPDAARAAAAMMADLRGGIEQYGVHLQERLEFAREAAKLEQGQGAAGHRAGQPRAPDAARAACAVRRRAAAAGALMAAPAGAARPPPHARRRCRGALLEFQRDGAAPLSGAHARRVAARRGRRAAVPPRQRRPQDDRRPRARPRGARAHAVTIWVEDEEGRHHGEDVDGLWHSFFGRVAKPVRLGFDEWDGADVVLATGWQTVHRALLLGTSRRAPTSSRTTSPSSTRTSAQRVWAEQTYRSGCTRSRASPWLAGLLRERYGVEASSFDLGVDHETYTAAADPPPRRPRAVLRARRHAAPRRAARPARARGAQAPPAGGRDRAVRRVAQDPDAVQVPRTSASWRPTSSPTPTRAPPSACACR